MRRFNGTAGAASILPRFDSQTVTVRSRSMVKDDGTRLRLSVAVWAYVQAHSVARQKLAGWNGLRLGTEKAQSSVTRTRRMGSAEFAGAKLQIPNACSVCELRYGSAAHDTGSDFALLSLS